MSILSGRIPFYLGLIKTSSGYLAHNFELFDIFQGNLLPHVERDLAAQLSKQSYEQARFRIAPINILRRIIDKLSKIYQPGPVRRVLDGDDSDADLMAWYAESWAVDARMNTANEYFNLFKTALIQPYLWHGQPKLRLIPSDRFIPYSDDDIDDTQPTGFVICLGDYVNASGKRRRYYKAVEAYAFVYFDEDGLDLTAAYAPVGNEDGVNTYEAIPFVYVNRSSHEILPVQDTDTLRMTKLIPILLADANYAAMFQAFSVFYGINVSDENMKWGPNTFLSFKTDPGTEVKPEIGTLTPNLDVDGSLALIAAQLAFWLNSRGVRPGSIGEITAANFQSGISKIVDEMDTSEDRGVQVDYFAEAEKKLWDLQLNHIHPVWRAEKLIENQALFSSNASVEVIFTDQKPFQQRGTLVSDLRAEVEAGFTTRKRAIKALNPDMTDEDVDGLESDIGMGGEIVTGETAPDGEAPDTAGEPAIAGAAGSTVQQLSLNGSQVESLLAIITQVVTGMLPKASAKAIIRGAFAMSDETINAIIDPIEASSMTQAEVKGAPATGINQNT